MQQFSEKQKLVAAELARNDLYFFTRWMFLQKRGYQWLQAAHHAQICAALMRVFHGETKRLIINIPPRYSKTEIAVVNFVAWCFGMVPDCEFIHASYSATLAVNNSANIRSLIQHEAYQTIFPNVVLDSEAKNHWKTVQGGVFYATGAGGTITGFGAGKQRSGFGGCFPVGTKVWTENGKIEIDRIVKEKLAIKVWCYDYEGNIVLRDVTDWHSNPPNSIVRVHFDDGSSVECTPCHKFWTNNRGWVRADSLCKDDSLPCVNCGVKNSNDISINAKGNGSGFNTFAIFSMGSIGSVKQGNVSLLFGQFGSKVGCHTPFFYNGFSASNRFPRATAPNALNNPALNVVFFSKLFGRLANSIVYLKNLLICQNCTRVNFSFAKSTVHLAVNNIRGSRIVSKIIKPIIRRVAISVANICSFWSFTNKSQQNQAVNGSVFDFSIFRKANTLVRTIKQRWFKHFSLDFVGSVAALVKGKSVFTSYSTKVTHRVQPFISGNRKPNFVEFVRHDDHTFCLTVDEYHNFIIEQGLVVKNCIILDDPHKADEARSEVMRQNVIDWFQNTVESRKNDPKNTPIIVIMQRLHESDLAGWLLGGGNGEEWELLNLPAINADGTPLWEAKHSIEQLRQMEQAAPYMFAGQYMQRPAPLEGGVFKPSQIEVIDALPVTKIKWVRGWDLGATVGGDPTAGVKLGLTPEGHLIIADLAHGDFGPDARDAMIRNTASLDGKSVRISLPQDPGQAGKTQALYLTRMLHGYRVKTSPESGDKLTRAEPFAAQVNIGNVKMLKGGWNQQLINEMRLFPNGNHDDCIDACSRAYAELLAKGSSYFG